MGASNELSTGNKSFFNVSYGAFSTRSKNLLDRENKMDESKLKSMNKNCEQIDLRGAYIEKDGNYPYVIFFDTISGNLTGFSQKKQEGFGTFLVLSLDDGLEALEISMRLHSKYAEDILNRLSDLKQKNVVLKPYSIPSEWEGNKFYNQGIVIYESGEKVPKKFKTEEIPAVEKIEVNGTETFSRSKRIDFLFKKATENFLTLLGNPDIEKPTHADPLDMAEDDLPF